MLKVRLKKLTVDQYIIDIKKVSISHACYVHVVMYSTMHALLTLIVYLTVSPSLQEDYHDDLYAILPHPKFSFLLLLILFITIIVFTAFKYKLNSFVGLCFVTIYLLFLTYAFVQDTVCEDGKHC